MLRQLWTDIPSLMSLISHMLSPVRNFFSVVDCKRAYHQIPMASEDVEKTAITTPIGLYHYRFMPFGLKNATQTWKRFITEILLPLKFCFVYLDDILLFSSSVEDSKCHLKILCETLTKAGIELNHSKDQLHLPYVKFLGYTVSAEDVSPPPDKVNAIKELPRSTTFKELRRFLGTINYYRRHLPGAAEIQVPLTDALAGKNTSGTRPIYWSPAMYKAFSSLKDLLSNAITIAHPHPEADIFITTDASDTAIGAVLSSSFQKN